ncbi:MAG: phosphoribosylamine--glycine ligase [Bacillota bacterium]|jgi:phosphoribosylamine--glycine ligase|nr:phosphoribosylamine--glycine ligase [Bacillota bacterium]HHU43554.1 phosphoribosylamine--glycine ligase [Clostridiales bacterium]
MDILLIGKGGREHAIAWALKKSPKVNKIYCLPGNGGIEEIAECEKIGVMDFNRILKFLQEHPDIGLTVVAPDDPLAEGLVDILEENGYRAFGPNKAAAHIEASKSFAKNLMKKYNIPTPKFEVFDDYHEAIEYVRNQTYPIVVKADGLALGKGVIICNKIQDAENAVYDIMVAERFGKAGKTIVVEEFIEGKEVSILTFCDGKTIKPMVSSQDHKRVFDDDKGLNTGGMGAFSPSPVYTPQIADKVYNEIILPTMNAMNQEGRPFKGVLYFGLIMNEEGVKVLEYNARFGDPETQVVLPLLETDLFDIMQAVIDQKLDQIKIKWQNKSSVCIILTSGGYPLEYQSGYKINIGDVEDDILLFHAGTKKKDGDLRTAGGRVLGVTAVKENLDKAREAVYNNIKKINFEGMHYRKDIGIKND